MFYAFGCSCNSQYKCGLTGKKPEHHVHDSFALLAPLDSKVGISIFKEGIVMAMGLKSISFLVQPLVDVFIEVSPLKDS